MTPNLVDPSRSAELFASFAQNPVVVSFVAALFGAYLLVLVWARRKDLRDVAKVWIAAVIKTALERFFCYAAVCLLSTVAGEGHGATGQRPQG